MRGAARALLFVVASAAVAASLRSSSPGIPDPDTFYHYRHAALYARDGLLTSGFPWLPYSIIARFSSDIGYGFHVFLIPFTWVRDPETGIRLAAVVETTITMLLVYLVLRRHRVAYAFAWPFVLLFLSPPIIWTVFQTRPQTLAMGLAALVASSIVGAGADPARSRAGTPLAFVAALLISFVHLNVFPIIPLIIAVAALAKGVAERRWEWRTWLAALTGVVAGWALRPNPLGTARLEWVQIAVHELVRQRGIPLLFGREWLPVAIPALGAFLYFIVIWAGITVVFAAALAACRRRAAGKRCISAADAAFLWTSLALSVIFFVASVVMTKRAVPFWATFAVMFAAKSFSCFLDPRAGQQDGQFVQRDLRLASAAFVLVLALAMVWTGVSEISARHVWRGVPIDRMEAASLWIKDHVQARPGTPVDERPVVYNADWAAFPELFFWNPDACYVTGLDPIFLYAYSENLYWKSHHLQAGEATNRTWGTMAPPEGPGEETYSVLRDDFHASAVIVDMARNPALFQYLQADRRFTPGFNDGTYAVFTMQ